MGFELYCRLGGAEAVLPLMLAAQPTWAMRSALVPAGASLPDLVRHARQQEPERERPRLSIVAGPAESTATIHGLKGVPLFRRRQGSRLQTEAIPAAMIRHELPEVYQ